MEIFSFLMPDIGEGVVEGEVVAWLKNVGDRVAKDEPVITLMTDKATVDLPSPEAGVLKKQYYAVGQLAKKGTALFDVELPAGVTATTKKKSVAAVQTQVVLAKKELVCASGAVRATPYVRKLAKDIGVDLAVVTPTGPQGRIVKEDLVHRPTHIEIAEEEGDERQPIIGIRALIAKKMSESKKNIPHFALFDHADATSLVKMREKIKPTALANGVKLTFMPFFLRALSLTLKTFPQFNASFDALRQELIVHKKQKIGCAMKTKLGLVVPHMQDLQQLSLSDIIEAFEDLKARCLANQLKKHEMTGSTFTLSNFGSEGGLWATPVINAPEVGILATARIHKQPYVDVHGHVVAKDMLNCSWSFDHRIIDGDMAIAFSSHFIRLIESPAQLL